MKKIIFLLAAVSLLTTSCATLFSGSKDRIVFKSNPAGATIYKNGIEECKTPCTLSVKRSFEDTDVEFKLDGYETRLITLDKKFNTVSILNLGNLIGWGIDFMSGSIMKYDKKQYELNLSKENKTSMINPTKINIDTKNNVVEVYVEGK